MSGEAAASARRLFEPLMHGGSGGIALGLTTPAVRQVHLWSRPNETIGTDTVFEIGSVTKAFTGIVLADMVARGEVGLDDPIERYLPPRARPGRSVTLRSLATHTSGLPRVPLTMLLRAIGEPSDPYAHYSEEALYSALARATVRGVGVRLRYSNLGFALLGKVLARASGAPFEELVVARLCRPLGLDDTRFARPGDESPRTAVGHSRRWSAPGWHPGEFAGAGGLRSTLGDMMEFVTANLHPERTPLRAALELAQRPQVLGRKSQIEVGLGWLGSHRPTGAALTWHNGETGGFATLVAFERRHHVGVVALRNARGSPKLDDAALALAESLVPDRDAGVRTST